MRKLLTVVVLVALLLAGAFFLSEKVFKPQAQITGFAFLAVDNQGQASLEPDLYHDGSKAMAYAGGTLLMGQTYESEVDETLFKSAEDLVKTLKIETWDSFSSSAADVPAGHFGVLITYADGSCISATSQGLSPEVTKKAIDMVTSWAVELVTNRLGVHGNPLLELLNL